MHFVKSANKKLILAITIVSLLILGVRPLVFQTSADQLPMRQLMLSDPTQGVAAVYNFSFNLVSSSNLGSIRFQFCSDTPLIDYPCNPPDGFDTSFAVLNNQTGETGFSLLNNSPSNEIVMSRPSGPVTPGPANYVFDAVLNPSANGSYFVRIQTYASEDATGPHTDYGGLSFVINDSVQVTTKVPPYLLLCSGILVVNYDCSTASGDYINFGALSTEATKTGKTELVLATNDPGGYDVYITGSTMTSGTDVIPGLDKKDVSRRGVSQFGINLANNTSPDVGADVIGPGSGVPTDEYGQVDRFRFVPGDRIIAAPGLNDLRKYTVSYLVNIQKQQEPGIYVSTLTYVAVANF